MSSRGPDAYITRLDDATVRVSGRRATVLVAGLPDHYDIERLRGGYSIPAEAVPDLWAAASLIRRFVLVEKRHNTSGWT